MQGNKRVWGHDFYKELGGGNIQTMNQLSESKCQWENP